jgi:hypothetical protein
MNKPRDFKIFPHNSIMQNFEAERVATNIIVILSRTGNEFRDFTWEEYKEERKKDSGFSEGEKQYFDKVIDYFKSPDTTALFCPIWKNINSNK